MTVAVVFSEEKQVDQILPWAAMLARSRSTTVTAIVVKRGTNVETKWSDIDLENPDAGISTAIAARIDELNLASVARAGTVKVDTDKPAKLIENSDAKSNDDSTEKAAEQPGKELAIVPLIARSIQATEPVSALAAEIETMSIDLLVIPNYAASRSETDDCKWHGQLYRRAPCESMFLHDDVVRKNGPPHVLVVVTGNEDDRSALETGHRLTESTGGQMSAYYFEPAIDDVAEWVGRRLLQKAVKSALGSKGGDVTQRVVMSESLTDGLRQIDPQQFDIVLIGSRQRREISRVMDALSSTEATDAPAICALRRQVAFTNRLINRLQNAVERHVPQLTRDQRISLVERVQVSSRWDFDFVAMICLSTMIAALGLIDNSVAVVIGAMLVAPLMTPIIGCGLGLAQGNMLLMKTSFRTVSRGFFTALLIGVLVGLVVYGLHPDPHATSEMEARDIPGFLDLVVALVSGIAAAYALGRPNLLAAIPGVAIAAALVPPLATSGLSFALFDWNLLVGALLLFLTNMIAIVLGTTVTFWFVGIRSDKKDKASPTWPRWLLLGLIIATIILTGCIESYHHPEWWGLESR